jgi:hypothetical protein
MSKGEKPPGEKHIGPGPGHGPKSIRPDAAKAAAQLAVVVGPEVDKIAASAAPAGARAMPGDFAGKLRLAVPHVLEGLILAGAIAADGKLSPDEAREVAGKIVDLFRAIRPAAGAGV